jgi:hypothetical protein
MKVSNYTFGQENDSNIIQENTKRKREEKEEEEEEEEEIQNKKQKTKLFE